MNRTNNSQQILPTNDIITQDELDRIKTYKYYPTNDIINQDELDRIKTYKYYQLMIFEIKMN